MKAYLYLFFKKWSKENNKIENNSIEEKRVKPTNMECINNKNNIDIDNELLSEMASAMIDEEIKKEDIVYWTPRGKTYHAKRTCRTLARSKVINSGTVYESGKGLKCENCK